MIKVIIFHLLPCKEEGEKVIFHMYEVFCFTRDFFYYPAKTTHCTSLAFILINKSKLGALKMVFTACNAVA